MLAEPMEKNVSQIILFCSFNLFLIINPRWVFLLKLISQKMDTLLVLEVRIEALRLGKEKLYFEE
jgi:hypothetical protein